MPAVIALPQKAGIINFRALPPAPHTSHTNLGLPVLMIRITYREQA
jgi:hypothetical protein